MVRYYCDYCHSYLTHDTLSVRKSHLIGKNHLRITADYYQNKHYEEHLRKGKRKPNRKHEKHEPVTIHLLKNKEKRVRLKQKRKFALELEKPVEILSKVYDGSPGYSKVFIAKNRFDIGESVKSSGLPQRANERPNTTSVTKSNKERDRNETIENRQPIATFNETLLPPPQVLSQWINTVPKTTIFNEKDRLTRQINDIKRRIIK